MLCNSFSPILAATLLMLTVDITKKLKQTFSLPDNKASLSNETRNPYVAMRSLFLDPLSINRAKQKRVLLLVLIGVFK